MASRKRGREVARCRWAESSEAMRVYHDAEWGRAVHDDDRLFEMLTLEGAQTGLSWAVILGKREGYREAFHAFRIEQVAQMTADEVDRLVADAPIVKNRSKINSVVSNAKVVQKIRNERKIAFSDYVWGFLERENERLHGTKQDRTPQLHRSNACIVTNKLAENMAAAMKKDGFKYVGPSVIYSFNQAIGMTLDHDPSCFCFDENAGRLEAASEYQKKKT